MFEEYMCQIWVFFYDLESLLYPTDAPEIKLFGQSWLNNFWHWAFLQGESRTILTNFDLYFPLFRFFPLFEARAEQAICNLAVPRLWSSFWACILVNLLSGMGGHFWR